MQERFLLIIIQEAVKNRRLQLRRLPIDGDDRQLEIKPCQSLSKRYANERPHVKIGPDAQHLIQRSKLNIAKILQRK